MIKALWTKIQILRYFKVFTSINHLVNTTFFIEDNYIGFAEMVKERRNREFFIPLLLKKKR